MIAKNTIFLWYNGDAEEAGEVEGLRGGDQADAPLTGGIGDRKERGMGGTGQGEWRMDLVTDHPGVEAFGQFGHFDEFVPRRHRPGRVVGRAEDQDPRSGFKAGFDRVEVEGAPAGHRSFDHLAADFFDD